MHYNEKKTNKNNKKINKKTGIRFISHHEFRTIHFFEGKSKHKNRLERPNGFGFQDYSPFCSKNEIVLKLFWNCSFWKVFQLTNWLITSGAFVSNPSLSSHTYTKEITINRIAFSYFEHTRKRGLRPHRSKFKPQTGQFLTKKNQTKQKLFSLSQTRNEFTIETN